MMYPVDYLENCIPETFEDCIAARNICSEGAHEPCTNFSHKNKNWQTVLVQFFPLIPYYYSYRVSKDMGHEKDFLTVGSMGHTSSIALGVAMQKPKRQIFCLDGDGSVIMHMGAMATVGQSNLDNFKHIVINNGAHDSVGGQPTDAGNHEDFSFSKIAQGCGYKTVSIILA